MVSGSAKGVALAHFDDEPQELGLVVGTLAGAGL
jgi:hypothetical protein